MVLVGPSGCGKTTALRMIAGLEEITSGEIRIGGKVVNDLAPRDRDIAMVFQNYALYPHKSVYENLAFGLRMRRVPKAEQKQRVEEIARILGLGDMLQRRPAQLSGGQRQRVAMGRAIVREPKAFLMDEPLSNLDAKLRARRPVGTEPACAVASSWSSPSARNSSSTSRSARRRLGAPISSTPPPSPQGPPWVSTTSSVR